MYLLLFPVDQVVDLQETGVMHRSVTTTKKGGPPPNDGPMTNACDV